MFWKTSSFHYSWLLLPSYQGKNSAACSWSALPGAAGQHSSLCGCWPARHTEPQTHLAAKSSLGFQSCELHLHVQDCQHLDCVGAAFLSAETLCFCCLVVCFLPGLTFTLVCGSLQEKNVFDFSRFWVHVSCAACSCANILQGQYGVSGEKERRCMCRSFNLVGRYHERADLKTVSTRWQGF